MHFVDHEKIFIIKTMYIKISQHIYKERFDFITVFINAFINMF